jgi:hypothetical protein
MNNSTRSGTRVIRFRHAVMIGLSLLLMAAPGCKVKLISDYDDITDRSATELQKKVEGFVHKMVASAGTTEGVYSRNAAFYDDARTDLSAIRVRASAMDKNNLTLQELDLIQSNLTDLEKLHQLGGDQGLRKVVADPALAALNTQFTALIKLELAKKRGR